MTQSNDNEDQVKLDKGFQITCKNCGCTDCKVNDSTGYGSSQTGMYGSVDIICPNCGQTETIFG